MSEPAIKYDLAHVGVKGMKWGVRKDRSGSSSGPKLTPQQQAGARSLVKVGAVTTAALLGGPVAMVAVSGLAQAMDQMMTTSSSSKTTETINVPAGPSSTTTRRD